MQPRHKNMPTMWDRLKAGPQKQSGGRMALTTIIGAVLASLDTVIIPYKRTGTTQTAREFLDTKQ